MKDNFKIIDAHCHIFPDAIAKKAAAHTDAFYGLTSDYDGTVGMLLEKSCAHGVDHFVIHSVATSAKQVSSINQFIAREVALYPGRFTGLGTMHPESTNQRAEMEELLALGLNGVKLHPDIQGFRADEDYWEIYEMAEALRLPVLIHAGDYRYDYSNPDRIERILKGFPKLKLIGAHLGGWSVWDEASERLSPYPNYYVDTCSSFYDMKNDPERALRIMQRYGTDRIMFATDYPMWNAKDELDFLFSLGFSEESLRKILYENAERIYGAKI